MKGYQPVIEWLNAGLNPDAEIIPICIEVAERRRRKEPGWQPNGLEYFTPALMETRTKRAANGEPYDPLARVKSWDESVWRTACQVVRDQGEWKPELGPPPDDPGCLAPRELLREFGLIERNVA